MLGTLRCRRADGRWHVIWQMNNGPSNASLKCSPVQIPGAKPRLRERMLTSGTLRGWRERTYLFMLVLHSAILIVDRSRCDIASLHYANLLRVYNQSVQALWGSGKSAIERSQAISGSSVRSNGNSFLCQGPVPVPMPELPTSSCVVPEEVVSTSDEPRELADCSGRKGVRNGTPSRSRFLENAMRRRRFEQRSKPRRHARSWFAMW